MRRVIFPATVHPGRDGQHDHGPRARSATGSLLEGRKRDLGITFDTGMDFSRDLALGLGLGSGQDLDIGM